MTISKIVFKFIILCSVLLTFSANAETQKEEPANTSVKVNLNPKSWNQLQYSSLKANKISGDNNQLIIEVDKSSSPLIYKQDPIINFKTVIVEGEVIDGKLNLNGQKQGLFKNKKSFTDDYVLRFGLVLKGKNRKPPVPGFLLASWIKEMFKLAPTGAGVDKIYFLKVVEDPNEIGQTRNHPLSEYLFEESVAYNNQGKFKIEKTFPKQKELLGLWISANGEGTQSKFKTKITKIEIK